MGKTIEVTNLSPRAGEAQMRQFFSYCGPIRKIVLEDNPEKGRLAKVVFVESDSVDTAKLLSGAVIVDQPITVTLVEDGPVKADDAFMILGGFLSKGFEKGEGIFNKITGSEPVQQSHRPGGAAAGNPGGGSALAAGLAPRSRGMVDSPTAAASNEGPNLDAILSGMSEAKAAVQKKARTVKMAFNSETKQTKTNETWMYGSQPQWGPQPAHPSIPTATYAPAYPQEQHQQPIQRQQPAAQRGQQPSSDSHRQLHQQHSSQQHSPQQHSPQQHSPQPVRTQPVRQFVDPMADAALSLAPVHQTNLSQPPPAYSRQSLYGTSRQH